MSADDAIGPVRAPLLDDRQFNSMRDALGADFGRLVAGFFRDCAGFETGIGESVSCGDAERFRKLCHEIKGAAALLGFSGISSFAAKWEILARTGRFSPESSVREDFSGLVADTRSRVGSVLHAGFDD